MYPFEQELESAVPVTEQKLIILDRDGTVNEDSGYTHKISELRLVDQTVNLFLTLKQTNFNISSCVITNQSGVSRKLFSLEDLLLFNNFLSKQIYELTSFKISKFYNCLHLPIQNCNCRKPKTYSYEKAIKDFKIGKKDCIAIGNSKSDRKAAENFGIVYADVNDHLLKEKVLSFLK